MIGLGFTLQMVHVCGVCKQKRDEEKARTTGHEVNIFGAVKYAICPCCGQKALRPKAKAYQKRAEKWVKEQAERSVEGS